MADGTIKILCELATDGLKAGLKTATAMIAGATAALGAMGTAALKVGTKFESSMSQVAATMGITKDTVDENGVRPFEILSKAAKDAGASTKYSAAEAADGLNYLALAGYDAEKSAEALPVVLNLAAAGGLELAYASDLATDAMAALGIEANKKNLTEFGDKMAKTASKANTNVAQLGEAILTVGGTAKGLARGTTELNAAIGVLANRGIKGAEGGTALRNVILALSAPTDKAAAALKSLGVNVNDAEGKMRPLNEIFKDLNDSLSDMSDSKRTQVLNEIFNKVDLKSAQALLAGCGDEFDNLVEAIDNSDGAMQQMADTMNDNLTGQITILKSALEGLGIEVYESVQEPLKNLAKQGTKYVNQLTAAFKKSGFSGLAKETGNVLASIISQVSRAAPKIVKAAVGMIDGLLSGIKQNRRKITKSAVETGLAFLNGIFSIIPDIIDAGLQLLSSLLSGFGSALPKLIPKAVDALVDAIVSVITNIDTLLEAGGKIVAGLLQGILNAVPRLVQGISDIMRNLFGMVSESEAAITESLDSVKNSYDELTKSISDLKENIADSNAEIDATCTVAQPWIDRLAELESKSSLTANEQAEWNELLGKLKTTIPEVSELINDQTGEIDGGTQALTDFITQWKNYAKAKVYAEMAEEGIKSLIEAEEALTAADEAYSDAKKSYNAAISDANSLIAEMTKKYPELEYYQGRGVQSLYELQMAIDEYGLAMGENAEDVYAYEQKAIELANIINGLGGDFMNLSVPVEECGGVLSEHRTAVADLKKAYDDANATVNSYYSKSQEYTQAGNEMASAFELSTGRVVKSKDEYTDALTDMYVKTKDSTLKTALELKSLGKEADEKTKSAAASILDNFSDLPANLQQSGKDILLGLIGGMDKEIPELKNASKMSADELVKVLKDTLGIHSPSTVTKEVGKNTMEGLKNGICENSQSVISEMRNTGVQLASGLQNGLNGQIKSLTTTAKNIANSVLGTFRKVFDIHSPAKATEIIGLRVSDGLVKGITRRKKLVETAVKGVADTATESMQFKFIKNMSFVMREIEHGINAELSRVPMGALSFQIKALGKNESAQKSSATYNITNNVESPVPITVAESAREANRQTENTLFKLGVYGV